MDFRVSVVVTSYNQKQYLIECLESVIRQTVKPYEIIIADDCSTDGSGEVIRGYVEKYPSWVRAVFQPANVFIPKNRNAGLREVLGNYVMILDGDDLLLPQNLEFQRAALAKNPLTGCVYTNLFFIDDSGVRLNVCDKEPGPSGLIFPQVAAGKMGMLRSMVARTDLVKEAGGMDETFPHYDGYILTLRLAKRTEFATVVEPVAEYRVHRGTSSTMTPEELYRNLEAVYAEVLKNIVHLSFEEQDKIKKAWGARLGRRRYEKNLSILERLALAKKKARSSFLNTFGILAPFVLYCLLIAWKF